jgi:hypothetical protein
MPTYLTKILQVLSLFIFLFACNNSNKGIGPALTEIPFERQFPSAEPNLFTDSLGNVYLSWIEKKDKTSTLLFSKLENNKWSEPIRIASGDNWFVNWADFPQFVTNGKDGFLASILVKRGKSTYAYDIHLYSSTDGQNWKGPVILHDDGKEAEHGFVSMMPGKKHVLISWLDGRNAAMENSDQDAHEHEGAMSLRAAYVDYTGKKINEWELDKRVCDCCQTGIIQTSNGPVVIYRDRSADEVRDISIVRMDNEIWTEGKPIYKDNWNINGCPVNGPKMDVNGNTIAIAWYAEPQNNPEVKVIFSDDGGKTFNSPVRINAAKPTGRVDISLMEDSTAMVSWIENEEIKAITVSQDGKKGIPFTISKISSKRSSGFPQMTRYGKSLIFAWTDDIDINHIKTARVIF